MNMLFNFFNLSVVDINKYSTLSLDVSYTKILERNGEGKEGEGKKETFQLRYTTSNRNSKDFRKLKIINLECE